MNQFRNPNDRQYRELNDFLLGQVLLGELPLEFFLFLVHLLLFLGEIAAEYLQLLPTPSSDGLVELIQLQVLQGLQLSLQGVVLHFVLLPLCLLNVLLGNVRPR